MQKILIVGYLGRDPELKYTPQGAVIAQFSIASSERWKDKNGELQERTEWFAVKAFGRRAEIAGEYLPKGAGSTWRAASALSPGTTRKPGARITKISSMWTGSSSSILEAMAMENPCRTNQPRNTTHLPMMSPSKRYER
jgi:single-strand DNA-binding protein